MQIRSVLKPVFVVMAFFAIMAATGCSVSGQDEIQTFYGQALGTSYSIKYVGEKNKVGKYQHGVNSVLDRIDQSMSTYLKKSELNRFNDAPVGEPFHMSDDLFYVVSQAQIISEKSVGAFDITVEPLVDLWGFGPSDRPDIVPDKAELTKAFDMVGYSALQMDTATHTVTKIAPREIDLSAIAKGYAVDKVAEYLDSLNISAYLVEVGGEMRLKGKKPNGDSWRVAIETPESGAGGIYRILPLSDRAIATSGDYRNYFEVNGKRYSHTIDPKTGFPIDHPLVSVSVITDSCAIADGWATAMMVLGTRSALELAEKEQLAVFLIEKTADGFKEYKSSLFDNYEFKR
ncbi:membrane-associated lipoprotein involved in thiamine biosynthesis [Gynuella sunshinyii YC6258]|uniref:FAD:protein FMN transferase n=2 Tax=Gynuella sunshinyii TaxID=1445505 RepID=A0A0C5VKW0_9GAMM|nr:membrane-associated lipoprotein involved in thiamine biosynthesis [Gynuella sunshinyii YC6258]